MESFYDRTELLLGKEKVKKLSTARIAVFGIGGVGGFAFESLVRCGIKNIDVFDGDTVKPSNLNRQIIATNQTLKKIKLTSLLVGLNLSIPKVILGRLTFFIRWKMRTIIILANMITLLML